MPAEGNVEELVVDVREYSLEEMGWMQVDDGVWELPNGQLFKFPPGARQRVQKVIWKEV